MNHYFLPLEAALPFLLLLLLLYETERLRVVGDLYQSKGPTAKWNSDLKSDIGIR